MIEIWKESKEPEYFLKLEKSNNAEHALLIITDNKGVRIHDGSLARIDPDGCLCVVKNVNKDVARKLGLQLNANYSNAIVVKYDD